MNLLFYCIAPIFLYTAACTKESNTLTEKKSNPQLCLSFLHYTQQAYLPELDENIVTQTSPYTLTTPAPHKNEDRPDDEDEAEDDEDESLIKEEEEEEDDSEKEEDDKNEPF